MRNIFALTFTLFFCFSSIWAEDGSALWLRYASGAKAEITSKKQSPTLRIAVSELQNFWQGGIPVTLEVRNNKELDRKSTRLNSSHWNKSRMPSSA